MKNEKTYVLVNNSRSGHVVVFDLGTTGASSEEIHPCNFAYQRAASGESS